MKTIKRVLLSVILLQAVCQPVNAAISFDLKTAKNITLSAERELKNAVLEHPYIMAGIAAGTALGTYYHENIKRGFNKVVNTIKTHPKKSILGASLATIGLLSFLYKDSITAEFLLRADRIFLSDELPKGLRNWLWNRLPFNLQIQLLNLWHDRLETWNSLPE